MAPFDESLLDDEGRRLAVDRTDLLRALAGAGAQVRHAVALAGESDLSRVAGGDPPDRYSGSLRECRIHMQHAVDTQLAPRAGAGTGAGVASFVSAAEGRL